MPVYTRKIFKNYLKLNASFGFFLLLLVCIPRFLLVLYANQIANYSSIGLIMLMTFLLPFIILNREGIRTIGWKNPSKPYWLFLSIILGLVFALLLGFLGSTCYQLSDHNWYFYIGKSYNIPDSIAGNDKLILFLIMAGTGMIFSPFAEELFFRGLIHQCFVPKFGQIAASRLDSLAFALTHLAHFGIVFSNQKWQFLLIPALIWVISMYLLSRLFFLCKQQSKSIFAAILAHAAFNLAMIYWIFYQL